MCQEPSESSKEAKNKDIERNLRDKVLLLNLGDTGTLRLQGFLFVCCSLVTPPQQKLHFIGGWCPVLQSCRPLSVISDLLLPRGVRCIHRTPVRLHSHRMWKARWALALRPVRRHKAKVSSPPGRREESTPLPRVPTVLPEVERTHASFFLTSLGTENEDP